MFYKHLPLLALLPLLFAGLNTYSQKGDSAVYTSLDIRNRSPIDKTSFRQLDSGDLFIRMDETNGKPKKIEIRKKYSDYGSWGRKAKWMKTSYGNVLAFKVLKTPGYECVIIFCDKDFVHDSLLIKNDTLSFKEMEEDQVFIRVVYPAGKDTLLVREGSRNTSLDFPKKIFYNPALKNYSRWFDEDMLDEEHIYLLVKNGPGYRIVQTVAGDNKQPGNNNKSFKSSFRMAASAFWVALSGLSFY